MAAVLLYGTVSLVYINHPITTAASLRLDIIFMVGLPASYIGSSLKSGANIGRAADDERRSEKPPRFGIKLLRKRQV